MRLPQVGERFEGRYWIESTLGVGGFGTVFGARDAQAGRAVALKVLKPDHEHGYLAETHARFVRETRVIGQLTNPHTVSMYDCGQSAAGLLYMAFEQVPGVDLSELLHAGPLDAPTMTHILLQVLESLREAHRAGLLHRDIKPENIRVFRYADDPFTVKLLDFGLARHADGSHPSITATGELIGTLRYMSPEQLVDANLTAASDIYSLGIVAIEMLVGRDALSGGEGSVQLRRLVDGLEVAEDLRMVLSTMIKTAPTDRFGSADAVLAALTPKPARVAGARPSSSKRWGAREALVLGLALAVVGLVGLVLWLAPADSPPTPPPQRRASPLVKRSTTTDVAPKRVPEPDAATDVVSIWSGCDRRPPFVGMGTLREDGAVAADWWPAYVPKSYDPTKASPIIVMLHQATEHGALMLAYSGFIEIAEASGAVLLAPTDETLRPWNELKRDARRIREALDVATEQLCIDERRVYIVGQGEGGRVAAELGCQPWVTAVATNSFRTLIGERLCEPARPVAQIAFSGMTSRLDVPEGGASKCSPIFKDSVDKFEAKWRKQNGCRGKPRVTFSEGESVCQRWSCKAPFTSCRLDGGQGWPGSPERTSWLMNCDATPPKFATAKVVWDFFEKAPPLAPRAK